MVSKEGNKEGSRGDVGGENKCVWKLRVQSEYIPTIDRDIACPGMNEPLRHALALSVSLIPPLTTSTWLHRFPLCPFPPLAQFHLTLPFTTIQPSIYNTNVTLRHLTSLSWSALCVICAFVYASPPLFTRMLLRVMHRGITVRLQLGVNVSFNETWARQQWWACVHYRGIALSI